MYIHPSLELILRLSKNIFNFNFPKKKTEKISLVEIKNIINDYPISLGDSLMVHSSLSRIKEDASEVLSFLRSLIGDTGTLLMPTHPVLENKDDYLIYDIENSQSSVGYLTEYFRQCEGVIRSKHPYASIAVQGPRAEYYLEDNLEDYNLPHGVNSAYHRFCLDGGKVLGLGVSAISSATVKHVAEEVLDKDFPLNNIFEKKVVKVYNGGKYLNKYSVRIRTNDLIKFLAKSRLDRDFRRAGITINNIVGHIPVDFLDSKACLKWMYKKALKGYTMYAYARYITRYK